MTPGENTCLSNLGDNARSRENVVEKQFDGTALLDGGGVVRHVNDVQTVLPRSSREELIDQNVQALAPPRYRDANRRLAGATYARLNDASS
jgi:hypothetical protein